MQSIQVAHLTGIDTIAKIMSLTDFATSRTAAMGAIVLRPSNDCALLLPCIRIEEVLSMSKGLTRCTIYVHFGVAVCNTRNAMRSPIHFDINCSAYTKKFESACTDLLWDSLGQDTDVNGDATKRVLGNAAKMTALSIESAKVLLALEKTRQACAAERAKKIQEAADARKKKAARLARKSKKRKTSESAVPADESDSDAEEEEEEEFPDDYTEEEKASIRKSRETKAAIAADQAKNRIYTAK